MNDEMRDLSNRRTNVVVSVCILLLIGFSWSPWSKQMPQEQLNEAIVDAGIIYATSRGINALVSAFQGTELDISVLQFSVGEILDPVNDLIERFSGVVTFAIASLVVQKLLLIILTQKGMSILITCLGVAAAVTRWIPNTFFFKICIRGFMLALLPQMLIVLTVLANSFVDSHFLLSSDSNEFREMKSFERDLEGIDRQRRASRHSGAFVGAEPGAMTDLLRYRDSKTSKQMDLMLARAQLASEKEKIPALGCKLDLAPTACKEVQRLKAEIESLEADIRGLDALIKQSKGKVGQVFKKNDPSCGLMSFEECKKWFEDRLLELESNVDSLARSALELMGAMIMKSIVVPLLFLVLFIFGTAGLGRGLLNHQSGS